MRARPEFYASRFERLRDVRRHVVGIVLGEHAIGFEAAVAVKDAFGHDALSFAEEIGQHARVCNGNFF